MTPQPDVRAAAFRQYQRKGIAEMRAYEPGEVLSGRVSVSVSDREAGSPKAGDMIARNPSNHSDQWLVAAAYFAEHFELSQLTTLSELRLALGGQSE